MTPPQPGQTPTGELAPATTAALKTAVAGVFRDLATATEAGTASVRVCLRDPGTTVVIPAAGLFARLRAVAAQWRSQATELEAKNGSRRQLYSAGMAAGLREAASALDAALGGR